MNRDIDDGLSSFRDRRHTNDNYASSRRNNRRTYRRPSRDYNKEHYTPDDEGYPLDDELPEEKPHSRLDFGDTQPARSTRYSIPLRGGTATDRLDFSNNEDL